MLINTSKRFFSKVKLVSQEVQLNGFKITAANDSTMGQVGSGATEEKAANTLFFLHGLLGSGRGWR